MLYIFLVTKCLVVFLFSFVNPNITKVNPFILGHSLKQFFWYGYVARVSQIVRRLHTKTITFALA